MLMCLFLFNHCVVETLTPKTLFARVNGKFSNKELDGVTRNIMCLTCATNQAGYIRQLI